MHPGARRAPPLTGRPRWARCRAERRGSGRANGQVIDGTMVKVYAWYDNEYGYSCRMVDIAKMVASHM